jgi:hypothetical protein
MGKIRMTENPQVDPNYQTRVMLSQMSIPRTDVYVPNIQGMTRMTKEGEAYMGQLRKWQDFLAKVDPKSPAAKEALMEMERISRELMLTPAAMSVLHNDANFIGKASRTVPDMNAVQSEDLMRIGQFSPTSNRALLGKPRPMLDDPGTLNETFNRSRPGYILLDPMEDILGRYGK